MQKRIPHVSPQDSGIVIFANFFGSEGREGGREDT